MPPAESHGPGEPRILNALQLSPEEEVVEIEVRSEGETLEFHIKDRGPGVPPR